MSKHRRLILFLVGTCLVLGVWHATFNAIRFHDSVVRVAGKATAREEEANALYVADQAQQDKYEKPLFILHLGPPKTGTSTIQEFAKLNMQMLREEDNVYYIGNVPVSFTEGFCTHKLVRNCRLRGPKKCRAAWKEFGRILEYHRSLNNTIFVSDENFARFNRRLEKDRLLRYLLPLARKWNMHVIFTYRRHYEIVHSQYSQLHNPATHAFYKMWPGNGGETLPSFANFTRTWEEEHAHYEPVATVKRWQERLGNVSIFNFHSTDGSPLLQRFFCQAIPQTPRTCQLLVNDQENQTLMQRNPSSSKHLHYDTIAVAAYKNGLINNATISRRDARQAVEKHATSLGLESMTDFPLEHLSEDQSEALLSHSLLVEQTLVPDFFDKAKVEAGFREYVETGRLASVNPMAVQEDPRWQTFFSKL